MYPSMSRRVMSNMRGMAEALEGGDESEVGFAVAEAVLGAVGGVQAVYAGQTHDCLGLRSETGEALL